LLVRCQVPTQSYLPWYYSFPLSCPNLCGILSIVEVGTAYPSGAHDFNPVFNGVRVTRSLDLYVMFCRSLLWLLILLLSHVSYIYIYIYVVLILSHILNAGLSIDNICVLSLLAWCSTIFLTIFQLYLGCQFFFGGENWSTLWKPPICHNSLANYIIVKKVMITRSVRIVTTINVHSQIINRNYAFHLSCENVSASFWHTSA
jgi:hypothetical protein